MAFEKLSAEDQKIVLQCMRATAVHVGDSEKHTRLGLEPDDLKVIIDQWPNIDDADESGNGFLAPFGSEATQAKRWLKCQPRSYLRLEAYSFATHCSCLLGAKIFRLKRNLSLKVKCHCPAALPTPSYTSLPPPQPLQLLSSRRSGAKPCTAQRSGGGATTS